MVGNTNIKLDKQKLETKIKELKTIQQDLAKGNLVTSLPFGRDASTGTTSKTATKMAAVNAQYAANAKKLSVLIDATIQYLNTFSLAMVTADEKMATN